MFSYHPINVSGYQDWNSDRIKKTFFETSSGWIGCRDDSFLNMLSKIKKHIWAPVLFKTTERKGPWEGVDWLVWDCDDPQCPPIAEAKERLQGMNHFIGTTKSHGREKNGIVCDRYRAGVKIKSTIKTLDLYQHQLRIIQKQWLSDQNCIDSARQYWPCLKIVSFSATGSKWNVVPIPPSPPPMPRQSYYEGMLAPKYQFWLSSGVPKPRHKNAIGIFLHCLQKGWTPERIRREWIFNDAFNCSDEKEKQEFEKILQWAMSKPIKK